MFLFLHFAVYLDLFCLCLTQIYIQNLFGWEKVITTLTICAPDTTKQNNDHIQTRHVFILLADMAHNSSLQSAKTHIYYWLLFV